MRSSSSPGGDVARGAGPRFRDPPPECYFPLPPVPEKRSIRQHLLSSFIKNHSLVLVVSGSDAQMKAPPSTVCSSLRHFGQVQPKVEPCPGFCGASPPSAHKRFSLLTEDACGAETPIGYKKTTANPVAPCPGVSCPCGTCLDGPDFERCVPEHHLGWRSRPGSVAAEAGAMTQTRSRERVAGCREPCRSSAPPPPAHSKRCQRNMRAQCSWQSAAAALNCRPSGQS